MHNRLTGNNWRGGASGPIQAMLLSLAALMCCGYASAADLVKGTDLAERATLSRDERAGAMPPALPSEIQWLASLGVSHIHAESGDKTLLTPFELVAKFNPRTSLKIEGDGYEHTRSESGNAHGVNNVSLILSQTVFSDANSRLRIAPGVTVPGGREVGSGSSKIRLGTTYSRIVNDRWDWLAEARLTRFNRQPAAPESRLERRGLIQAGYTFADSPKSGMVWHDILFHLERQYRAGADGISTAGFTYEFPLTKALEMSMVLTRGITSGARDNTVELFLSFGL